jgi:hypothetical protein
MIVLIFASSMLRCHRYALTRKHAVLCWQLAGRQADTDNPGRLPGGAATLPQPHPWRPLRCPTPAPVAAICVAVIQPVLPLHRNLHLLSSAEPALSMAWHVMTWRGTVAYPAVTAHPFVRLPCDAPLSHHLNALPCRLQRRAPLLLP